MDRTESHAPNPKSFWWATVSKDPGALIERHHMTDLKHHFERDAQGLCLMKIRSSLYFSQSSTSSHHSHNRMYRNRNKLYSWNTV